MDDDDEGESSMTQGLQNVLFLFIQSSVSTE